MLLLVKIQHFLSLPYSYRQFIANFPSVRQLLPTKKNLRKMTNIEDYNKCQFVIATHQSDAPKLSPAGGQHNKNVKFTRLSCDSLV